MLRPCNLRLPLAERHNAAKCELQPRAIAFTHASRCTKACVSDSDCWPLSHSSLIMELSSL